MKHRNTIIKGGKDIPGVGGVLPLETSLPVAPILELELVLLEYSLVLRV